VRCAGFLLATSTFRQAHPRLHTASVIAGRICSKPTHSNHGCCRCRARACAPPVSSLKSICTGTTWLLCPVFGVGGLSCSLRRDCPMRLPCAPATRLILSFRAATSSAKAELATSVSADMSGKAAPAPGALLKSGQVAQPGFPVVARERPVDTPPSYDNDDWDNIQWKLFLFGLALYLPSCVGVVLPLFSRPRFPTRGYKCAHPLETLS